MYSKEITNTANITTTTATTNSRGVATNSGPGGGGGGGSYRDLFLYRKYESDIK